MNVFACLRRMRPTGARLLLVLLLPGTALVARPVQAQATLIEVRPGLEESRPGPLTAYDGNLYFNADDGVHGEELWRYDPATGAAALAADIRPGGLGSNNPNGRSLAVLNGTLYFNANDGVHGEELWRYDDATGTASLAAEIDPTTSGGYPRELTAFDGDLYFTANDEVHGYELWRYDPVTGAAELVADIDPVAGPGSSPRKLTAFDGKLYFTAEHRALYGRELWVYDPATGIASLAADVYAGTSSSHPADLTVLGGKLYFGAYTPETGEELWVYDPATSAASLAADVWPGTGRSHVSSLAVLDGKLYFAAYVPDGVGGELRVYDPATGTAALAADINPGTPGSGPLEIVVLDGKLYFSADYGPLDLSGGGNDELWTYDPDTDAATLAAEIQPGNDPRDGSNPRYLTMLDGALYLRADDGTHGEELWRYDPEAPPIALTADGLTGTVPQGERLRFAVTLTNNTADPFTGKLRLHVAGPGGLAVTRTLASGITLGAGQTISSTFILRVPQQAPLGSYAATVSAERQNGTGVATADFTFEVVEGAALAARGASGEGGEAFGEVEVLGNGGLRLDGTAAHATTPPTIPLVSPNPASGGTALAFTLDASADVRLTLYDVLGRAVAAVDAGRLEAGAHRLNLDVASLPSGVYVWRLTAGERVEAGRLTVAR